MSLPEAGPGPRARCRRRVNRLAAAWLGCPARSSAIGRGRIGLGLWSAIVVLAGCQAPDVAAQPAAGEPRCSQLGAAALRGGGAIELDRVWTGVGTAIGAAATARGQIFAAYFDADRWATVTRFDPLRRVSCSIRLPSRFSGWDAHNSLAVAIAPDDTVHVVGNMHASPLFYARGTVRDVGSIRPASMIGRDELRATYPRFLHDGNGNLVFMYRTGGSGNGSWLLNRWQDGRWQRIGSIFADRDRKGPVSAYPSSFRTGADGYVHVAVVWRRTPDVASNFAVSYARTKNFQTWFTANGRSIAAPLSPDTMDLVENVGEDAGLVNRLDLALLADGTPVILYPRYAATKGKVRYDAANGPAIVAARPGRGGWRIREIATSRTPSIVAGKGALPNLPAVWILDQQPNSARVRIAFAGRDRRRVQLDLQTLVTVPDAGDAGSARPNAVASPAFPKGMEDVSTRQVIVLENGVDGQKVGTLRWFAQVAHGDKPRSCSRTAPVACDPPAAPLLWSVGKTP